MLSVTIFCYCPCQYLLYISALTARFAYVVGCCILPLPLSAFTAYFFVDGAVRYVAKPDKSGKIFSKTEDSQKSTKTDKRRKHPTKIDKRQQKQKRAQKWQKQTKGRKWRRITTKTCKNCQKAYKPLKRRQNGTKTDKTSQNNGKTFPSGQKGNESLKIRRKAITPSALSQNGRCNSDGANGKRAKEKRLSPSS